MTDLNFNSFPSGLENISSVQKMISSGLENISRGLKNSSSVFIFNSRVLEFSENVAEFLEDVTDFKMLKPKLKNSGFRFEDGIFEELSSHRHDRFCNIQPRHRVVRIEFISVQRQPAFLQSDGDVTAICGRNRRSIGHHHRQCGG